MKTAKSQTFLLLIIMCISFLPGYAQDEKTDAMNDAYTKAAAPGENHKFLESIQGEWNFTNSWWMAPGAEPMVSKGTMSSRMIMGGRYLEDKTSSDMMGMPFEGLGITGYDNTVGEFINMWIDNMGTGVNISRGQLDETGSVLTLIGEYKNPMTGQMEVYKQITKVRDPDNYVFEYLMVNPKGEDFKMMEIVYSRQK